MSKKKSIKFHPKYGLNPTIPICFYCGKDKDEIVALGASYKDEAPARMLLNLEPCDKCKERFKNRTLLVECKGTEPRFENLTGRWAAVWTEALREDLQNKPFLYIGPDLMEELLKNAVDDDGTK